MTYSLSVTGVKSHHPLAAKNVTLADTQATTGSQTLAAAQGTAFLCKNADGSQSFYRIDAERSTPSNPIVIALGP